MQKFRNPLSVFYPNRVWQNDQPHHLVHDWVQDTSNFVGPSIPTASSKGWEWHSQVSISANARDHSLQRGHQLGIGLENRWGWNIHQFQCWPMENRLGRLPVAQRNKTCKVGGGFGWGKLMNGIDTWIVRRWQGNICREMSQCPSLFEPVLGLFRPQRVTTLWLRSQVAHPPHTWADAKL